MKDVYYTYSKDEHINSFCDCNERQVVVKTENTIPNTGRINIIWTSYNHASSLTVEPTTRIRSTLHNGRFAKSTVFILCQQFLKQKRTTVTLPALLNKKLREYHLLAFLTLNSKKH